MPTLHADYVRLLYSTQKGKYRILHVHELSYLNVILVISLPERTGQDKMEKTEGFLEGTEINKDEIISTTNQHSKTRKHRYQRGTLPSVRRCQALSPVLTGCFFCVFQDHTERTQKLPEGLQVVVTRRYP